MTVRAAGDPLGAFTCPKCAGLSIQPRLKWIKNTDGNGRLVEEYIWIKCDDCDYGEKRPCADAVA